MITRKYHTQISTSQTHSAETGEHGGERPCNHAKSATEKLKQCAQRLDAVYTESAALPKSVLSPTTEGLPTAGARMDDVFELFFLRCSARGEGLKESE
jgi:hypothetical protein